MALKIDRPIVEYSVVAADEPPAAPVVAPPPPPWKRPDVMQGATAKIKHPLGEHAIYITLNADDTGPKEVFINTKDPSHFVWTTALTRIISAWLREGGNPRLISDELQQCFDPDGGYFMQGKRYGSVVAHIGKTFGDLVGVKDDVDPHMAEYIAQKRHDVGIEGVTDYPVSATICPKCSTKAVVVLDGCATCLHCGDSKCG